MAAALVRESQYFPQLSIRKHGLLELDNIANVNFLKDAQTLALISGLY